MKKVLLILGLLLGLIVIAAVVLSFSLGSIVRRGVVEFGPRLTQTDVDLESATLSPVSGTGTLTQLRVANPQGWSEGNAFSLGRIHVDLEPSTLLGDGPIVIEELVIEEPHFRYEQRLRGGSNIKDLLENIQQAVGEPAEQPIGTEQAPPRKFIIHKLRLLDGTVDVGVQVASASVPLPELAYDNLGVDEGGLTGGQIASHVLRDVLGRVVTVATAKGILSLPGGATGETLQTLGQGLQQLLGGKKQDDAAKEKPTGSP